MTKKEAYDSSMTPGNLAAAIRAARGWANISQSELAERIGTSPQTIKRWEAGNYEPLVRSKAARVAVAAQVAEATDAPREWLGLATQREDVEAQLSHLRRQMVELATLALDVDEAGPFLRSLATDPRSEGPGRGGTNE